MPNSLSPDAQAIVAALEGFERRQADREEQKHDENRRQIDAILSAQKTMQNDIKTLSGGFPNDDPESHRRYHESVIEWRELRNKMVKEALVKAAQGGGLAGLGWVLYALWTALKMEVMR